MPNAFLRLVLCLFALVLAACVQAAPDVSKDPAMPRNQIPPLFHPLRSEFVCHFEAKAVPPIDAQAQAWFEEALALDSPDIFYDERDYARIVALTRQAAQRQHWQAMLNLVNMRLESNKYSTLLPQDNEAVVREVEAAMQLGIPAAFDVMGNLYEHGIGVRGSLTKAYAFYQKAADLGHPQAMVFLGELMNLVAPDEEMKGYYANATVATQMFECAFSQGYGQGAYSLANMQWLAQTPEARAQAVKTLHAGVKMGNKDCASELRRQFEGKYLGTVENLIAAGADTARAERYWEIYKKLDWYGPSLKLPNLDKILPLPPAALPQWDGNRDSLINAAKAVRVKPAAATGAQLVLPANTRARETLPFEGFHSIFAPQGARLGLVQAPRAGYFVASTAPEATTDDPMTRLRKAQVASTAPVYFEQGQAMRMPAGSFQEDADHHLLSWQYVGQAQARVALSDWLAQAGWVLAVATAPNTRCAGDAPCPVSGIWQPAVQDPAHPLQALFGPTQAWRRQAFVQAGQSMPSLQAQHLAVNDVVLTWHLMQACELGMRPTGPQGSAA